jgi:hypothetical protein
MASVLVFGTAVRVPAAVSFFGSYLQSRLYFAHGDGTISRMYFYEPVLFPIARPTPNQFIGVSFLISISAFSSE